MTKNFYINLQKKIDGKSTLFFVLMYLVGFIAAYIMYGAIEGGQEELGRRVPYILGLVSLMVIFMWLSAVADFKKEKTSKWKWTKKIAPKTSPGENLFGLNVLLVGSLVMMYKFIYYLVLKFLM